MSDRPHVFISYRRADTLSAARGLLRFIWSHYGRDSVFMDTAEIRHGSDWRASIDQALQRSTVLLVLIGRNWCRLTDDFGQRRIDQPADWVRREVEHALENGKEVVPIYIGIEPLPEGAFPAPLKCLAYRQALRVDEDRPDAMWRELAASLQRHGFGSLAPDVRYPQAVLQLQPFDDETLRAELKSLPGWRCVASPVPGMEHVTRSELHKVYEFRSFRQAIAFMAHASIDIHEMQHHPRWENVWRTVSVWLSSWDLQFQVSRLDIELARHLDMEARLFNG